MKKRIQLAFFSLVLSPASYASNPIQGFYGGVLAGISHGPAHYNTVDVVKIYSVYPTTFQMGTVSGTVNNSLIGAGGGGNIGYRINSFRVEGELFYNYTSAGTLSLNDCTLQSPTIITPTGDCTGFTFLKDNAIGFNGSTGAFYGLANFYYDFVAFAGEEDNSIIPYVGFGIGGVQLKRSRNFVNTITQSSYGGSNSIGVAAAQGIIGVSFFLDDYAWIGTDFRYVSTGTIKNFGNTRYGLGLLNVSVNAAFDNSSS